MVVDPKALVEELAYLHGHEVSTDNLRISNRAHVILPYHLKQDELEEERKGDNKIGTTKKGSDRLIWIKLRVLGFVSQIFWTAKNFYTKLERNLAEKNRLFEKNVRCRRFQN
ncbi:hypothetical protein GCM10020331_020180 [Ectobacillus funiculus]